MERFSKSYKDRKRAWELSHHDSWLSYLKPLLEAKCQRRTRRAITSLDDAFARATEDAEAFYAEYLIQLVESQAREFTQINLNSPFGGVDNPMES